MRATCAPSVKLIAKRLGVTEHAVIAMNRRLGGDGSLNDTIRAGGDSAEWQDWLVDESPDQETALATSEEFDHRRKALSDALGVLNGRDRRVFEGRRLAEDPITLVELAGEFGVSRERVRQIEARAFEKVQRRSRTAWPRLKCRCPCRCISFQFLSRSGETADGPVAMCTFTATKSRE